MVKIEMIGKTFGRLTVTEECGKNKDGSIRYKCLCSCGNIHYVNGCKLRDGSVKSCGCLQKELLSNRCKKYNKWEINNNNNVAYGYTTNSNIKFKISLSDYNKCKDICWCSIYAKGNKSYYIQGKYNGRTVFIHRFILDVLNEKVDVDHIDHDPTNNTRENLRICSHMQNMMNIKKVAKNSSGTKGVYKRRNKWGAEIWVYGHRIYLGYYKDKKDAIKARKEAEEKYYKEWRNINEN